jgi:hypothetical protein
MSNFELIIRFSEMRSDTESSNRWTEESIYKEIDKYRNIDLRKIWVCGPPLMNELFDKSLSQLDEVKYRYEVL